MFKSPLRERRPGSRAWLITACVCGLLLVCSIVIGLTSAFSRVGRTMDLVDQPGARAEDYARMVEDSLQWTRLSLYLGAPVAVLYLVALMMYRRSRRPLDHPLPEPDHPPRS